MQSHNLNVFWRYMQCLQILHCQSNCFFRSLFWVCQKEKRNPHHPHPKIYISVPHFCILSQNLFTSVKPSFHISFVKMLEFILTVPEKWILSPSASSTKWRWFICTKFRDGSKEASSCNIFTTSQTKIVVDKQYTLGINITLKYDTASEYIYGRFT